MAVTLQRVGAECQPLPPQSCPGLDTQGWAQPGTGGGHAPWALIPQMAPAREVLPQGVPIRDTHGGQAAAGWQLWHPCP